MNYYTAMKKTICVMTWMNLKNITFSNKKEDMLYNLIYVKFENRQRLLMMREICVLVSFEE